MSVRRHATGELSACSKKGTSTRYVRTFPRKKRSVVLDRSTPESFRAFEAAIKDLSFILDCHLLAGDFDYFLKIRVRDIADFNKLHGEKLIALPGVRQTRTFFVMKEVTDNAPLEF